MRKCYVLTMILVFTSGALRAETPVSTEHKATAPVRKSIKNKKVSSNKGIAMKKSSAKISNEAKPLTRSEKLQAWIEKLKKKIGTAQNEQNKLVAVAAVRGSDVKSQAPLYWKGKETEKAQALPELASFDEAISSVISGDDVGAKKKLEDFISQNPSSPLVSDAKETLALIVQEEGAK